MGRYVSLHTHSEGSFLDGYATTRDLALRAKELGSSAVALTDHGECGLHMEFYHNCLHEGVKPILGMEGYLVDSVSRVRAEKDPKNSHLCLWAENESGLKNLWAWSSLAYMKGFYYKPLADWELAREYHHGLIASDGCFLSNMARYIVAGDEDSALWWGSQLIDIFGEDNFFMELHTFQMIDPKTEKDFLFNEQMKLMNLGKVEIAQQLSIPLIVVNDAHYAWEKDWENHSLVWAMSTNTDQTGSGKSASWMMDEQEIHYWLGTYGISPEIIQSAIDNTGKIGDRCNVEIKPRLHVPVLTGTREGDRELFLKTVNEGYQKKVVEKGLDESVYGPRKDEETDLIIDKGYDGYFNIVAEYCQWAKSQKMLVGPSRGSVGGSLDAFLMGITELDPVKYDLMFGRFIDPGRKTFPDIDLDFPQRRRGEVKRHLEEKYGKDHIASVGTLSRLQPRGILKDLCRAMGIPYEDSLSMGKIIEQVHDIDTANVEITWDEILIEKGGDLAKWAEKYPKLFQKISEMLGLVRQSSTHAGGVIISDESLLGNLPLRTKTDKDTGVSELVTQFEHRWVEELGYIKFDILGIRHLDTLTDAWMFAYPEEEFDPNNFYDFTDEMYSEAEIWTLPNSGHSLGIFQLEASAMESVTKDFKPLNHHDVKELISVNRPGVTRTGMLNEYIRRRHGVKGWEAKHPFMAEILAPTHGVVVYQEQVMKIVQKLAGYSLEEADKIRKIMGKMLYHEMKEHMPTFIKRCVENPEFVKGCPPGRAEEIAYECWQQIEAAGIYSFNEAHGMGYSLITCWCVWMKHHHFPEHFTALMRTDPTNQALYLRELRRAGIKILPPHINISEDSFVLTPDGVRYGLLSVLQVGSSAVNDFKDKKPFTSLVDFMERSNGRVARMNAVENLISVGAFDDLPAYIDEENQPAFMDRRGLLNFLWERRAAVDSEFRKKVFPTKVAPDFSQEDILYDTEVSLVGTFITVDPMDKYREFLVNNCVTTLERYENWPQGGVFDLGGQLINVKEYQAKNGLMAFVKVEFDGDVMEVICFADRYTECRQFLRVGRPVVMRVKKLEKGCQLLELQRLDLIW